MASRNLDLLILIGLSKGERIIEGLLFLGFMSKRAPIYKNELKTSLLLIALIVGVIALSSLLLFTQYWFVWPAIVACLLIAVGYFTASKDAYQCLSCEKAFKITALQDFFAPHGITKSPNGKLFEWKLLKCPGCSRREKCYRAQ
jgi:fatty-acid desaturase